MLVVDPATPVQAVKLLDQILAGDGLEVGGGGRGVLCDMNLHCGGPPLGYLIYYQCITLGSVGGVCVAGGLLCRPFAHSKSWAVGLADCTPHLPHPMRCSHHRLISIMLLVVGSQRPCYFRLRRTPSPELFAVLDKCAGGKYGPKKQHPKKRAPKNNTSASFLTRLIHGFRNERYDCMPIQILRVNSAS